MAGKWNGQKLYKGAAPGTHWCINDARLSGFTVGASLTSTPTAALTHINNYSFPSAYVSLTTSYAVAHDYASLGPAGEATSDNPGYVYEIDPSQATCQLVDPVELISSSWLGHEHDGAPDLILAVANPNLHGNILAAAPRRLGNGSLFPPMISDKLKGLVFAIRDAEVFGCTVPKNCVVNRHAVP